MEKIDKRLEILEKMVMKGNGREPLNVTVSRIEERQNAMINSINDLNENVKGLTTTVSALIKATEFIKGEERGKEKTEKINRWTIGIAVSTIMILLGYIIKTML